MTVPALVIFDCDGVLVDSERLSHEVLRQMLAENGVEMTLARAFELFMGASTARCQALLETLIGGVGRGVPADFLHQMQQRSFAAFRESLAVVPGVTAVLGALRMPFCVASNGPHEKMRFTLGHTGLLPHFEGRLFSAQDVARPKPEPDLFLHAAATLGIDAQRCVVVEDSATGVTAARAAGMRVLGFSAMGQAEALRRAGAHATFGAMPELPALLGAQS